MVVMPLADGHGQDLYDGGGVHERGGEGNHPARH